MELVFDKWSGLLWRVSRGTPYAYCPDHKHRLDVVDRFDSALDQDRALAFPPKHLLCPVDDKTFPIVGGTFETLRRRYIAALESERLKGATYRDLDNIYTPILRVTPKPKDDRYSVQVEIDETPTGKKLVIYAMDREDAPAKAQIFIDPEIDKLSFDSKSDLHPNMIFSKVEAYFKDGKKVILEQHDQD